MKVVTDTANKHHNDFYHSLGPVNHSREARFSLLDISMLTVLFLEVAALLRLFLAN